MPESQEPKKVINNDLPNSQFAGGLINAETVNAGRIGGDIWNIVNIVFGRQKAADILAKNRQLLLAQVKQEVASRLEQSLHNAVLINLGKESQPQQVKRLWDAEVKIGLKPPEPIPDTTRIIDVFDSVDVAGKLLILGAPGSGKTTTQLELAQELIKRAEEQPDYSVPVLFNLSSWKDDRQSITDWLVAELKSKYGVSKKLGQEWVDNHHLLPLLDGLDELEPQRQELCVLAINQFLASESRPLYLVVCSRSEEYSNYSTQLQLNGAIYLQPLTNNQICDYLTHIEYIEVWSTISSDLELLELLKTPLLLSISVLASQEISVKEWQNITSTADRIQYLLDAYIGRMLTRNINSRAYLNNKPLNARPTRMWLVWLAQQMQRESKTEFFIEEMQPACLNYKSQILKYRLILGLISGLGFGLISGLGLVLISGLFSGLILGLILGLIFGLYGLISQEIKTVDRIIFNNIKLKKILCFGLISGLISGLGFGLFYGLIFGLYGLSLLFFLLCFGLILDLIYRQTDLTIENKKIPNQGIWKTAFNAVFLGLIYGLFLGLSGLISGLISGLGFGLISGLISRLVYGLILGLFFGLILGLFFGGIACLQHFTLRLILYFNGYIPWNYARFLDYCTERLFLQRVGGRYRFIHKMLQDHFAQMEFKRN